MATRLRSLVAISAACCENSLLGAFRVRRSTTTIWIRQGARVDSCPHTWWVCPEYLLRARRGSEADRRRGANCLHCAAPVRFSLSASRSVCGRASLSRSRSEMFHHRALAGPQGQPAAHHATRALVPPPGRRYWLPCPGTPGTNNFKEGKNERQSRSDGAVNADGWQRSRLEDQLDPQPSTVPQLDRSRPRGCGSSASAHQPAARPRRVAAQARRDRRDVRVRPGRHCSWPASNGVRRRASTRSRLSPTGPRPRPRANSSTRPCCAST